MPVTQDALVLLLINGASIEAAEAHCVARGDTPDAARIIVSEARKRITVAADYTRHVQPAAFAVGISRQIEA